MYEGLIKDVLDNGELRETRNGKTISLFGRTIEYDLAAGFPLVTTKKVFWRGVVEELLWFLSGNTSAADLSSRGVNIWNSNATREYLDGRGLDYPEGELGPIYSWQWRRFGATFPAGTDGVDQISQLIEGIKSDPYGRRHLVSAWNPVDLPKMALPPCHVLFQFYVGGNTLSCQMYQRSCDVGLGLPFNIASYAALTHMVASVCNLTPGRLIIALGDTHVYEEHVDVLKQQLLLEPRKFPRLELAHKDSIFDYKWEDFKLLDYHPHVWDARMNVK